MRDRGRTTGSWAWRAGVDVSVYVCVCQYVWAAARVIEARSRGESGDEGVNPAAVEYTAPDMWRDGGHM